MAGTFESFMENSIKNGSSGGNSFNNERKYEFFSLEDGETKTYRFVTGFDEMLVFDCDCGVKGYEVPYNDFVEASQSGAPIKCPKCGKVLTEDTAVAKRPQGFNVKRHWAPGEGGKQKAFTCKGVGCPICAIKEGTSQKFPARDKVVMYAIEVEVQRDSTIDDNGMPHRVISGIKNATMENGGIKFIQFERSPRFDSPIYALYADDKRCDHYLFNITRTGTGTNTTYTVDRVSGDPCPDAYANYGAELEAIISDTQRLYTSTSSDEFYAKNGYSVNTAPQVEETGAVSWEQAKTQAQQSYLQ